MTIKPASLIHTGALPTTTLPVTGYLTPPQIAQAYGLPSSDGAGVKIGIISPGGGGFLQSDLNSSFTDLRNAGLIPSGTPTPVINQVLLDGEPGTFSTGDGSSGENTVDIYCAALMAPAADITIYIGNTWESPISRAISDGCDILTISWASTEGYEFESLLAQAASAKIAVCVASGDWGSSIVGFTELLVCYPSSSPKVISIGGTKLTLGTGNTRASETDDNRDSHFGSYWGGGGGISSVYSLPTWQQGLHYTPIVNNVVGSPTALTMRGLPDIAAPMNTYALYFGGTLHGFGGTSLSSPTMAGILARMQNLTGAKRSSEEYNTIFYANKTAFYDITVGTNNTQIPDGYAGTVDWDPVTGLGPPIGSSLLTILNPNPPYGTLLSTNCQGFDKWGVYANGTGGTYDQVIETNSTECGYVAPPVASTVVPSIVVNPFTTLSPTTMVSVTDGLAPFTWTLDRALPAGLIFSSNGQLSGMTTAVSTASTYTATVTDAYNRTSSTTFSVRSAAIPLSATVNNSLVEVHPFVSASGFTPVTGIGGSGVKTYSITPALPSTYSFNTGNGLVTPGIVTTLFTTTYTVTVSDQVNQTASGNFVLRSTARPITVTSLNDRLRGYPYVPVDIAPLQVTGGNGNITFSIVPDLPAGSGLSFNPITGVLSGTPQQAIHSNTYLITAQDQFGLTQSAHVRFKTKSPLNVIDSDVQNLVYNSLFDIMGTTSTGYGAELIGDPVTPGDPIKADNWNRMIKDVERCLIHQNGTSTNNILIANTGSIADFATPARMYTTIQYLQKNVGHADPSQIETFTYNTNRISPVYWTSTNYVSTTTMIAGMGYMVTIDWSWFYENQIRYFFNLGGKFNPEISIDRSRSRAQEVAAWASLVEATNQVTFGLEEFRMALENPEKKYTFVVSGSGDWDPKKKLSSPRATATAPWIKHLKPIVNKNYKDTKQYSSNAITVTFQLMKSDPSDTEYKKVIGTVNFVAGLGFKNKGKKKKTGKEKWEIDKWNGKKNIIVGYKVRDIFTRQIIGKYIGVRVRILSDFRTTYPNGNNGGIAAQIPQAQIIASSLSASPSPIPQFSLGIGDTSPPQTIILRNNTTQTCIIDDIVLSGYTTGTVTPTSLSIPSHSSTSVSLTYTGTYVGHHRGLVDILSTTTNRLTLFTEVNVGSTNPRSVDITTSTYDVISQDFIVDHAGGYFKDFSLVTATSAGFTFTSPIPETDDSFNITFNPKHFTNGIYATTATVIVQPLDSSQRATEWQVPFRVNLQVVNRHIADWESCTLGDNTRLGISYDIIGGKTYLTAGIGLGSPDMMELRSDDPEFTSWLEVYRIQLESATRKVYSKNHCVKSYPSFKYGDYFGVGTAGGSLFTINYDGQGNIEIVMNTVYTAPERNVTETLDMSTAFRYYDSRRRNQLQSQGSLTQGSQTFVFTGFDKHGETRLALVAPN